MTEASLPDKVLAIHRRLRAARMPHAFGGALALAYYAEPRATIDIDVNVFVAPARHPDVEAELAPLGVGQGADPEVVERDGQVRLWWESTPVDLFYAYDDLHAAMRRAARRMPFGSERIPVLAPEHLASCKAILNRPKDWLDIEQMLVGAPELDVPEARGWLERILDEHDPRVERFAELARRLSP